MSRLWKTTVTVFGINMLVVILIVANGRSEDLFMTIGLLWLISLPIQLIVAIVLLLHPKYRETGWGILLGLSIGLLIGFSVCSVAL